MILTDKDFLCQPCQPCLSVEEGLEIIAKLSDALTASPTLGVGLAANQIGIQKRVCLLRIPEIDSQGFQYNVEFGLINPKIIKLENPVRFKREGCLSFPGQWVETLRYTKCIVIDDLEPAGRTFIGMRAIVAQHEIDHTLGKTMYHSLLENVRANRQCPCGSIKNFRECCKIIMKEMK